MKNACRIATSVALLLALTSCDASWRARAKIDRDATAAERLVDTAKAPKGINLSARGPVTIREGEYFLGNKSVRSDTSSPIPQSLLRPNAISLIPGDRPLTLAEIAGELAQVTGLRVVVNDEDSANDQANGATSSRGNGEPTMVVNLVGPLPSILDSIAARFNISYDFKDATIIFNRFETRRFTLWSLGTESAVIAGVDNGQSSQQGNTTANGSAPRLGASETKTVATIKIWDQIEKGLRTVLAGRGRLSASPSTGTITVVAPPAEMRKIAAYLRAENEQRLRQVAISVSVLSVTLSETDTYQFDLTTMLKDVVGNQPLSVATDGAGLVNFGILKRLDGAPAPSATEAVIKALSQRGNVSVATQAAVTTLNDQPAPLQVAKQTSYLASVSQTSTVNAGTTASLTPGTVTSGFTMNLLPRIVQDGRIILQFNIAITDLRALRTVSSGGQSIQVPEVDSRSFLQHAMLQTGDTLVLTGFQQMNNSDTRSGVGAPWNILLGGESSGSADRTMIAIVITPEILPPAPLTESLVR